jgi:hypothetical protein
MLKTRMKHFQLIPVSSKEDALLEQHSITCKLCDAKFDSLGDMQRHVLTERIQLGDYQIRLHKEEK